MIDPLALRIAEMYATCKEGSYVGTEEVLDALDDLVQRIIMLEAKVKASDRCITQLQDQVIADLRAQLERNK